MSDDAPRYYCQRCRALYFEPGECDWCPAPLVALVNCARRVAEAEEAPPQH